MPRSRSYFVKTLLLSFFLFVESLVLTSYLFNYAIAKDYFTLSWNLIIIVFVCLLAIAYTYALTIGAWDTWLQFIIIPLPISLANALIVARINYLYALLVFFSVYLFTAYDVFFATRLKDMLIKFDPKIILRFSTKGLLLVFALMGGLLVLLTPIAPEELNLVETVATIVDKQANTILDKTLNEQKELRILQQTGLISIDFKKIASEQMTGFIEPYQHYLVPILAVLVIGSIQFLNSFVYLAFSITIDLIFLFAKKSGLLKTDFKEVMQEVLTF